MADDTMIGVEDPVLDDAALEALAEAHAAMPPPRLRTRLLAEAQREAVETRMRQGARSLRRWRAVGAIAAAAVLVLGGHALRESGIAELRTTELRALARTNAELSARLDEQGRMLAALRESAATTGQILRVLAGPRTITASLGPKEGVSATGRVVVDASTGEGAILVSGLAPLGPDRTYELWTIRGNQPPEPAGLFASEEGRTLLARVATLSRPEEVTAFALSIEPAAGSPRPTGPIVLIGPTAS